jgi:hypothetical protein
VATDCAFENKPNVVVVGFAFGGGGPPVDLALAYDVVVDDGPLLPRPCRGLSKLLL